MPLSNFPKKLYFLVVTAYITKNSLQNEKFKKKLIDSLYNTLRISINNTELTYLVSQIKLLDSRFNINRRISDKNLTFTWKLLNESPQELNYWKKNLNNLVNNFNSIILQNNNHNQSDYFFSQSEQIYDYFLKSNSLEIDDKPRNVRISRVTEKEEFNRSIKESAIAIFNSNQKCEAKCNHKSFVKINSNLIYLEAHHLIPISIQSEFDYSLDVSANIVALCPMCHREIHLGKNRNILIEKLYEDRKIRLRNCLISISLERLIDYY